jgi:hypothetical protein
MTIAASGGVLVGRPSHTGCYRPTQSVGIAPENAAYGGEASVSGTKEKEEINGCPIL